MCIALIKVAHQRTYIQWLCCNYLDYLLKYFFIMPLTILPLRISWHFLDTSGFLEMTKDCFLDYYLFRCLSQTFWNYCLISYFVTSDKYWFWSKIYWDWNYNIQILNELLQVSDGGWILSYQMWIVVNQPQFYSRFVFV